ncbi:hypothetical protein [Gimesia aquarii]|uniref:hypothetical protein n=1 Tax=Gimesia aquarii TaxID=2527964 RepID=UPI0011A83523|nr:hypothetical protein [Gimesia aquarii]
MTIRQLLERQGLRDVLLVDNTMVGECALKGAISMIDLCRILLLFFGLVLMPILLILSTPFILLWPRAKTDDSYGRIVLHRYGKIIQVLSHIGNAIG